MVEPRDPRASGSAAQHFPRRRCGWGGVDGQAVGGSVEPSLEHFGEGQGQEHTELGVEVLAFFKFFELFCFQT